MNIITGVVVAQTAMFLTSSAVLSYCLIKQSIKDREVKPMKLNQRPHVLRSTRRREVM